MRRLNSFLLLVLFILGNSSVVHARFIKDYDLHLYFGINDETKEATVGSEEVVVSSTSDAPRARADIGSDFLPEEVSYRDIVIPSTITNNGVTYTVVGVVSKAFYKMTEIHTVSLPETIRFIGANAFGYCVSLESINLPNSIMQIGNSAFFDCKKLESVHLPASLQRIEDGTFSDCVMLEEINIPGNCQSIGIDAFKGCKMISRLIIEDETAPLQFTYTYGLPYDYESQTVDGRDMVSHYRGQFADSKISYLYMGRNILYPEPQFVETENRYINCLPFDRCLGFHSTLGYIYSGPQLASLEFGVSVTNIPNRLFYGDVNVASSYHGNIASDIVFPSNLQTIGELAFYSIPNNEIILPATLESVASQAFTDLSSLQKLQLSNSLTDIGSRAFGNCNNLKELTIQENLTNIGEYAFGYKCYPIFVHSNAQIPPTLANDIFEKSAIYVPAGTGNLYRQQWKGLIIDPSDELITVNVKKSGTLYSRLLAQDIQISDVCRLKLKGSLNEDDWDIVQNMTNLYDWDLSELESDKLPDDLLKGNASLINISLPRTLTSVSDSLFKGCNHLVGNLDIPANCHVGTYAFAGTNIENISITGSAQIGKYAFSSCPMIQEVYAVGNGVNIGEQAFTQSSIQKVTIGNGVTVSDSAYFNCTIDEIYMEDGVKSIGNDNFRHVKMQVFQGNVEKIGLAAFSGADEVYVSDITTWCHLPFSDTKNVTPHLYIGDEEVIDVVIPAEVTEIRKYLFHNCESLSSVNLHEGIVNVGDSAFINCTQLIDVNLPLSLRTIKNGVFSGCSNLKQISLPSNLVSIGDGAFNETGLTSIQLPSTMKSVGNRAFFDTNITSVQMPKSLSRIGNYAFASCSLLEDVDLSPQTTFIGEGAFQDCVELKQILLPNSISAIKRGTFSGCTSLQEIKIPSTVSAVESLAFGGCSNLISVIVQWENPPTPEAGAFTGISPDCYLYTPIGTSTTYFKAGWDFFNYLKEAGLINIVVNNGGKVIYNNEEVVNKSQEYLYSPYKSFNVTITPDDGFYLKKVNLNGQRVTDEIDDNNLFIEEPEENLILSVVFADENIEMGDVNGDGITNTTDAEYITNHIVKKKNADFHEWSADMNDDDVISVTDAIIVISKIIGEK